MEKRKKTKRIISGQMVSRVTKAGMVGSMAAMLYYAYRGNKKPHIKAGKAFVIFTAAHMVRNFKYLLK